MSLSLDLLYNLRLLRKSPGHIAMCVLVIGLGMGLSITGYSILSNFGPKDLPFPDGDKHVTVLAIDNTSNRRVATDGYIYQMLQSSVQSYKTFGAMQDLRATLSDGEAAEQFRGSRITPNLMQALGVAPLLGRGLLPRDDIPGAEPVVLISFDLWQSYYLGREDIIGVTSRINGEPYTIVGVMPDGFLYPGLDHLWIPLRLPANPQPGEGARIQVSGILAENVSMESASAEINELLTRLADDLPEIYAGHGGRLQDFATMFEANTFMAVLIVEVLPLLLTVALVLLVCLNVANLILVRTNERIQEFAICSSLGATRWRLIKSILQDSLLICFLGALFGIALADLGMSWVRSSFQTMTDGEIPFWMTFDWEPTIGITALLAILLIWLSSAALAYWQVSRLDLSAVLAAGKTGSTGSRNPLGTSVLVSVEMVFSCFLLVLGGVLVGVSTDVAELDYGTTTEGYMAGRINLLTDDYTDNAPQELYRENLKRELLQQRGIEQVSFATALPSEYGQQTDYNLEDRDLFVNNQYPSQHVIHVAPDYFETMELALSTGRAFDSTDTASSLPVVIVEELFAEQMWPSQSALGKRIQINAGSADSEWLTIVGVIPHIIQSMAMDGGLDRRSLYRPLSQSVGGPFSIVAKTTLDPVSFRQAARQSAVRVDRDIPVTDVFALATLIDRANAPMLFSANMFLLLALITLVLASTGIYALVSRSIFQRSKESGVRRAVGSTNKQLLWVFMRPGFKYLGIGLLIGGGCAALIANAVNSVLPGSIIWLPLMFVSVSLGLGLLVFISTYSPARLLVAMEPGDALHYE